jgi:probable HAF family extracellular repeat protein
MLGYFNRIGLIALLATMAASGVHAQSFSIQNLGYMPTQPPASDGSWAFGVSADGTVAVGYSNFGTNGEQAFRWTGGVMTGLGYLGGDSSLAYAVSADGTTVVGHATGASGSATNYAFEWQSGGMWVVDFSKCGGQGPFAYGVSGDGSVIVGDQDTDHIGNPVDCFPGRAIEWTGGGENFLSFAFVSGGPPSGLARGTNTDGSVIVGEVGASVSASCNPCTQAYRWTSGGYSTLGDFGGNYSSSYATNTDGSVIVGTAAVDNVSSQPFRWTATSGLIGLGGQSINAIAYAVSADGVVVVGQANGKAFRWQPTTGLEYVQDLLVAGGVDMTNWNLTQATGISADGSVIVGNGGYGVAATAWLARVPPDEIFAGNFE